MDTNRSKRPSGARSADLYLVEGGAGGRVPDVLVADGFLDGPLILAVPVLF